MSGEPTRRRFLAALGSGSAALAGCAGDDSQEQREATGTPFSPPPRTRITTNTETWRENRDTIFVDAENGSHGAAGTRDDPFGTFREAVKDAEPGETIHAKPGEYREWVIPPWGGEPGAPITITGPPDAVLTSDERRFQPMQIRDSHIHVTGLTIDGLWDPDDPSDPESYARSPLVEIKPRADTDDYLEDVVFAPHGLGNAYAHLLTIQRTRNAEVGPFEVTGLAGANYVLTGEEGRHVGEVVYVGTPPSAYGAGHEDYPWTELDRTRNVHVHHVDNSAGHPHSELVNTKLGTHDVLVEYCTDGGGSRNTDSFPAASIRFQSYDATLRWCDLRDGGDVGVWIDGGGADWLADRYDEPPVDPRRIGSGHEVYGSRIAGFGAEAVLVRNADPDDQVICGNEVEGEMVGPGGERLDHEACPADLPEGQGFGHEGGEGMR